MGKLFGIWPPVLPTACRKVAYDPDPFVVERLYRAFWIIKEVNVIDVYVVFLQYTLKLPMPSQARLGGPYIDFTGLWLEGSVVQRDFGGLMVCASLFGP